MKDPKSIPVIAKLHPNVRETFTGFIEEAENALGITLRVVQGLRTFAEQDAIYAQGRTKPGKIVTWSPAGASYHNYGLAIDVCPLKPDHSALDWSYDFMKLLPFSDKHSITAGLNFPAGKKDPDHFELKLGLNWRELLHRYQAKDFIPGTEYVNI